MSEAKLKKPIYKRWWFWVGALLVFIMIASGDTNGTDESPASSNLNEASDEFIPGLTAADVKLNLTDRGFECGEPLVGDEYISYQCNQKTASYEYIVEFDGISPTKIISVQASALNYGNESLEVVAKDFLGYLATLPYEGSTPEDAKLWVQEMIGQSETNEFGGVQMRVNSTERAVILTIGK